MKRIPLIAATLLLTLTAMAQKDFTLEDLNFGGNNYRNMIPANKYNTWWGDELIRQDLDACYITDKAKATEKPLFTLDDVNNAVNDTTNKVRHLYYATFPYADKTLVLVSTTKKRMLVDWKAKTVAWEQTAEGESYTDWNAASRASAYVSDNQLCVRTADNRCHRLTTDGSREIVYGQAVHRNEFGIYKGTFWSNDGQRLAFYRMDQSMVADYPQVNIDTRIATCEPDKYPMAGQTSHKVRVGIYDLQTDKTIYLNTGDETDRYFSNIAWAPDGQTLYLIELNRDQTDMKLDAYDASTGEKKATLYTEHDDKYVEPLTPIRFLPWDDTKFLLQSQRDGYNHLYLMDVKGNELKQLTKGPWCVISLLGFNVKAKTAIILSTERSPVQYNLYAVSLKDGRRTLLDNGRGVHTAGMNETDRWSTELSTSGQWLRDSYSEPDVPRNIELIQTTKARRYDYFAAPNPWEGYNCPQISAGTIKAADGTTDLYYRLVKPHDFDPTKKYPTVVYVYGGPHARNIRASWNWWTRGWEPYMAQKGYLVFVLDNRGSEHRGKDFEQVTFRQLGQEEMKDQMKGIDFLKTLPYVDSNRLGVHGWSYGGYMTISLMTNYPDVFKVGVAGGPVIDWQWYEVMYGERYMDTPQQNPEGYAKCSLLPKAKNLKGKLQIITGYNDATVVPQHCLSFIRECTNAGTQPDFFAYPGEEHNMRGHRSVHLHERITQYFLDYLR